MEIELNIIDYIVRMEANTDDENIIINWICSIDNHVPEDDNTEVLLREMITKHYQVELKAEYKRVAEEELGDMIIDRYLTDMD